METSIEDINRELNKVRPYLQIDGGDVEAVSVKDDIIEVRLMGSCVGCPLSQMTLRAGIERVLIRAFPHIRRIEAIE